MERVNEKDIFRYFETQKSFNFQNFLMILMAAPQSSRSFICVNLKDIFEQ